MWRALVRSASRADKKRRTDGFDLVWVGLEDLLHLLPGVEPVERALRARKVLPHGRGPVHQPYIMVRVSCAGDARRRTKVKVRDAELLERILERLLNLEVVVVVQLGGEEEGLAGDAGVLDALTDFVLVFCGRERLDLEDQRASSD
jgi:hypothetical protein